MSTRLPHAPLLAAGFSLTALVALSPSACTDDVESCPLLPGDLVITEVDAHSDIEWFELYNATDETIDLEGRSLIYTRVDGSALKRHIVSRSVEIPPGEYIVVGAVADEDAEASGFIDYGYGDDLGGLGNERGHLEVACGTTKIIDEISYDGNAGDPIPSASASLALDGAAAPDAIANDEPSNWCESKTPLTDGFAATPGAVNDPCGAPSTCMRDGELIDIVHPLAGELVFSELMPDPDGFEEGEAEWFELHSTASNEVHLNGLELGTDPAEPAQDQMFDAACIVVPAGGYALIAQTEDTAVNGELPAPDWVTSISSLGNSGGSLWVGLDGELLDAVSWTSGQVSPGVAINLDPGSYDPDANDDEASWCDATEAYNDTNLGTPQAANTMCPITVPEGQCDDGGEAREIVPLAPGELEIVEVQADPDCEDEEDGEWFELLVHASGDLNGLGVAKALDAEDWDFVVEAGACLTVNAGDRLVFARNEAGSLAPEQIDFVTGIGLNNSDASLLIGYDSPSAPDEQYSWAGTSAGVAQSKDAGGEWCDAVDAYGCGDLGTPGAVNPSCGGPPANMCIDMDTMLPRMVNSPDPSELRISEIMANPGIAGEPDNEWFELHTEVAMDLNGLQFGKDGELSQTITGEMCIEAPAGYLVFLHDGPNDCMVPVDYVYDGLSLTNGGDTLDVGYGGEVWHSYTWDGTSDGVALSYDPEAMSWCEAVDVIDACGDLGTPGAANPACEMGMGGGDQCFDTDAMQMRAVVPPAPGELVISEFMPNPVGTDSEREWFELRAHANFDLNGVELGQAFADGVDHTITSDDCIELSPGDNAVLARSADMDLNGGLTEVTYVYASLSLTNGGGSLHVAVDGVLLDEVSWGGSSEGDAASLDPGSLDPDLNNDADNPPWCPATTPYGAGGNGSPGADNPACN